MDLLLTDPPSLVVGERVMANLPARHLHGWVGQLLAWVRSRCYVIYGLDARELAVVIDGACRAVDPAHPSQLDGEGEVAEMARLIQRSLGRRARRALDDACRRLTSGPMPEYPAWLQAMRATALRTALWSSDDLEAVVAQLVRDYGPKTDKPERAVAKAVAEHPLTIDLVRYWLSDDYLAALS